MGGRESYPALTEPLRRRSMAYTKQPCDSRTDSDTGTIEYRGYDWDRLERGILDATLREMKAQKLLDAKEEEDS
ncbi:hypothetical protein LCGC14_1546420 [marine sediment metagenome]|uniref:Uncharacterized protein n=1 Tax=marine sediment metagenome TaxID=412755 RepID=A0A0F9IRI8_9ZZZZ